MILGIKEVLTHLGVFMLCKSITVSLQTQKPKTNPEKIKKNGGCIGDSERDRIYWKEKTTTQEPRKKEIVMEDCMRCCKQTMIYLYCVDVWYKKVLALLMITECSNLNFVKLLNQSFSYIWNLWHLSIFIIGDAL